VKDRIPGFRDEYRMVAYALILIAMMLGRPQGVFGRSELSFARWLKRRRPGDRVAAPSEVAAEDAAAHPVDPTTDTLRLRGVTKRFGGLTAVDTLDIALKGGELVGMIGPNGAGKTTVFNLLTGVYEPTEGTVTFSAEKLAGERPYAPGIRILLLAWDALISGFGGWIAGTILSTAIAANVTWIC